LQSDPRDITTKSTQKTAKEGERIEISLSTAKIKKGEKKRHGAEERRGRKGTIKRSIKRDLAWVGKGEKGSNKSPGPKKRAGHGQEKKKCPQTSPFFEGQGEGRRGNPVKGVN